MKMTHLTMWNAVTKRDKSLDGLFVYAVKTTKIYCRPTCPSRRPHEHNVEFFPTSQAAREAGYRACARCRPEQVSSPGESMTEQVRTFIKQNLDQSLTLQKIGSAIGTSPFHLQRVFKTTTGLTPREYADECRLTAVKQQLRDGHQVTPALYAAGYGSSSRLYERSSQYLGMTPGSYARHGAGQTINFAFVDTLLGLVLMAATVRGLCFLQFGTSEDELLASLKNEFSAATLAQNLEPLLVWIDALQKYAEGSTTDLDVSLDMDGTTFQLAVWRYLRKIPAGQTCTYTQVAEAIGQPKAVRAVARACAANKIALAIPCHRVVRRDGSLSGYRWGIERKQKLLQKELLSSKASKFLKAPKDDAR